jgi:hypothetical protein
MSLEGHLPEKVKELVMMMYNEATSHLCDILLSHDGIAIDSTGRFTTPFGKLSLAQVNYPSPLPLLSPLPSFLSPLFALPTPHSLSLSH